MTTFTRENLPEGTVLMNRRVRIVTPFPSLSAEEIGRITGQTGTCKWEVPDSDGDIYVELDAQLENGRTSSYVRAWEFLDGDTQPVVEQAPAVAQTPTEAQLERLIDAIYSGARANGYTNLLAELFEEAGIPLRPTRRFVRFRGVREVSMDRTPVESALAAYRPADSEATVSTIGVQAVYVVEVPWPSTSGTHDCAEVNVQIANEGDALIPDDVMLTYGRAVSVATRVEQARTHLRAVSGRDPRFGASVSCDIC